MTNAQVLERGREAFQRKAWAESYRLLHAAEREAALEPEDLEPLAMAGYLMGRDDESESAMAPAAGWFARAQRVQLECVVRGYLLIPAAIQRIMEGDPAAAHAAVTHAAGIASRFGDRSLLALACHGRGRALIRLGSITEGLKVRRQASSAATCAPTSSCIDRRTGDRPRNTFPHIPLRSATIGPIQPKLNGMSLAFRNTPR